MAREEHTMARRRYKASLASHFVIGVQLVAWCTAGGLLIYRGSTTLVERSTTYVNKDINSNVFYPLNLPPENVTTPCCNNGSDQQVARKQDSSASDGNGIFGGSGVLGQGIFKVPLHGKEGDKHTSKSPLEKNGTDNLPIDGDNSNVTSALREVTSVKISASSFLLIVVGILMLVVGCTVMFYRQKDLRRRRSEFQKVSSDDRFGNGQDPPPSYSELAAPPSYSTLCLNEEVSVHVDPD